MLGIFSAISGGIGLARDFFNYRKINANEKNNIKIAELKNRRRLMEDPSAHNSEREMIALRPEAEWQKTILLIILFTPLILMFFIPEKIGNYFHNLSQMYEHSGKIGKLYIDIITGIITFVFGLKALQNPLAKIWSMVKGR